MLVFQIERAFTSKDLNTKNEAYTIMCLLGAWVSCAPSMYEVVKKLAMLLEI